MYLRVTNVGEIEVAALFLLGASVKGEDAIGFFGSGNKYAMATMLRNGIDFRIFSGEREVKVGTQHVNFRGEAFDQIVVDDAPSSLTTRMGPTWETWFALREIVCNAIDEGGMELSLTHEVVGVAGKTTFYVDAKNDEVMTFFTNLENYLFLRAPTFETNSKFGRVAIACVSGESMIVYRRGVRVNPQDTQRKSLFNYDLDTLEINESRVYVYEHQLLERIATVLAMAPLPIVENFLSHVDDSDLVENRVYWQYMHDKFSQAWEELLRDKMLMSAKFVAYAPVEDVTQAVVLPDTLVAALCEQWPTLHVWGSTGGQYTEVEYAGDELLRARDEVVDMGYLAESLQLKTVMFEQSNILASYDQRTSVVAVDVRHISEDDYDELVTTLVEEGLHARGYKDGTREFEQFLMRELVKARRAAK